VTDPWNPRDGAEYTPEGLRARIDRVFARWLSIWHAGAAAGGLAAAVAHVECNEWGHVHLHVAYHGPWIDEAWASRTAGAIVYVQGVEPTPGELASALVETLKYALKSPSTLSGGWVSGDSRSMPHPRLAAAWSVATTDVQLVRRYGLMVDAAAAVEACTVPMKRTPACATCGELLKGVGELKRVSEIARTLKKGWSFRGGARGPLAAIDGKTKLPPRVIVRSVE